MSKKALHAGPRYVLSLHSTVLKRLCNSTFKEGIQRRLVLADDTLEISELMVEYFYTSDYKVESTAIGGTLMTSSNTEIAVGPPAVHAAVFTTTEKYDIPDLKTLAWLKFRNSVTRSCGGDHRSLQILLCQLVNATGYSYQNTPLNDKRMNGAVVAAWTAYDNLLVKRLPKRLFEMLSKAVPEFASDLVEAVGGLKMPE